MSASLSSDLSQRFYGLGDDWWKQIIDGEYHALGPDVFDKGLHGKRAELGYLGGAKSGSQKAIELLEKNDLTVEIYKKIHLVTCAHFKGRETNTADSKSPGNFRKKGSSIKAYLSSRGMGSTPEERRMMNDLESRNILAQLIANPANNFISAKEPGKIPASLEEMSNEPNVWEEAFGPNRDKAADLMSEYFKSVGTLNQAAESFGAKFYLYDYAGEIGISHSGDLDPEQATADHIEVFNRTIQKVKTEKEKITCIGSLFQGLEWIHPPEDGTTRTDLIIMQVLLCKYGLTPAILYDPNYAMFHTPDKWVEQLERGICAYKAHLTNNFV